MNETTNIATPPNYGGNTKPYPELITSDNTKGTK